jgi:2-(1,2-epoxy-1,2-dihydrophenyl)acetyl-CoA isomerase
MQAVTNGVNHGIAAITLNRPEKMNALNGQMFALLRDDLDRAEKDSSVRVVLISGAGRAFCTGLDLSEPLPEDSKGKLDLSVPLERDFNPLASRLMNYSKITVAALNGPAVGAGASLALACDIVVAARSAFLQLAFARIGLIPDAGCTWLLPRIVGSKLALALALTGDRVTADDAKSMGLIYRVFDDATFAGDTQTFLAPFTRGPATAYQLIKQAFRASPGNDCATQLKLEAALQNQAARTYDFKEAVNAFRAKRPPVFT